MSDDNRIRFKEWTDNRLYWDPNDGSPRVPLDTLLERVAALEARLDRKWWHRGD